MQNRVVLCWMIALLSWKCFFLYTGQKRRSLEREAKKRDSLLKHREQGELKPGVGGNIVIFYRISSFSNDYGNNFSTVHSSLILCRRMRILHACSQELWGLSLTLGSGIVILRRTELCTVNNCSLFFCLQAIEVTSPTAGSVLVDLSQLQMFQVCREVSVRTMSLYGESVDSVPAQVSSVLLRASHHSSPSDSAVSATFTSRLPCGESRGSLPARSPPTHQMAALLLRQKVATDSSDAKLTDLSSSHDGSARSLREKASSLHLSSPSASLVQVLGTSSQRSDAARDKKCLSVPPQQAGSTVLPGEGTEPVPSREAELQGLREGTEVQVSAYISCPVLCVLGRRMDHFGEWNKMPLSIFLFL